MIIDLSGKTAIVTGAAMGMGEATARLFAEAGANVVVADFNEEKGTAVARSIATDTGAKVIFVNVDVSDSAQVQAMVARTVEEFGELNVAVNNAALTPDNGPAAEFDEDYWDRLMSVDLKGAALCQKYELQQMISQGRGGSIINISSVSGFRPQPGNIAYVAAKHGVIGMTKVAALEAARHGVRVNSIHPSPVNTRMMRSLEAGFAPDDAEAAKKMLTGLIPLGRYGEPKDIANLVLFLASDESSFITGVNYRIDGGMGAQ